MEENVYAGSSLMLYMVIVKLYSNVKDDAQTLQLSKR